MTVVRDSTRPDGRFTNTFMTELMPPIKATGLADNLAAASAVEQALAYFLEHYTIALALATAKRQHLFTTNGLRANQRFVSCRLAAASSIS